MKDNFDDFKNKKDEKIEVKAQEFGTDIQPLHYVDLDLASENEKKAKLRKFLWFFSTMVLLLAVFFTTLVFSSKEKFNVFKPLAVEKKLDLPKEDSPAAPVLPPPTSGGDASDARGVFEKVSPSIVGVITFGENSALGEEGQGTGIILTKDGYILTNSHVIGNSKNNKITVVISNKEGDKEYEAKTVGFDASRDIAVLKVEAENLPCAELGNSDELRVGEDVVAIGNPGGMKFSKTLTKGIISALERNVYEKENPPVKFIQTDAAINPGNSGGALVNMKGQIIGITSLKMSGGIMQPPTEAIGFAIPINSVRDIINKIIAGGNSTGNVKLGVTVQAISRYHAEYYDIPPGVLIVGISEDSSLKGSKIEKGDIITKLDGAKILDAETLKDELNSRKPGDVVTLTVFRPKRSWNSKRISGETIEERITLKEDKQ